MRGRRPRNNETANTRNILQQSLRATSLLVYNKYLSICEVVAISVGL